MSVENKSIITLPVLYNKRNNLTREIYKVRLSNETDSYKQYMEEKLNRRIQFIDKAIKILNAKNELSYN